MTIISTVLASICRPIAARGRQRPARKLPAAAAAALALVMATPAQSQEGQETQEPAAVVEMTDLLTFEPATVTIAAGETVEWRNVSNVRHTATADPAEANDPEHVHLPDGAEPFNSGFVEPGGSWRHTFEVPGAYDYFCIPHEATGMLGTVIVEAVQ
jgi:plastocyanin